ncbi:MAG: GGDEF domain-containing response regulator [Gammaproteobacteria bacterium]|nr:MAG: GGDEF domain-containing response regulator [Gammaproteobacteria bacterium]
MANNEKNKLKIIVIDDNVEIHRDFIKTLTTSNRNSSLDDLATQLFETSNNNTPSSIVLPQFQIDTATQGQEGVERIKVALKEGQPYALAFVDIRMPPGWDGIETIKHMWEIDKDIQVVICTAYSDYSWEETISQLGQNDNLLILKKPFDSITIRQLACALTKKWELMQKNYQYTSLLKKEVEDRTQDLKTTLSKVEHQAKHDSLTNLPNRAFLLDQLKKTINEATQNNQSFSLLFLDLDRFKLVNDSLSHAVGDVLLQSVATRLQEALRPEDTLARLGGDEFVIILPGIDEQKALIKTSELLRVFNLPFNIADRNLIVSVSIGICVYPKNGNSGEILLRNADAAMYHAKEIKGSNFQFYSDEMSKESLEKLEQEMQLRHALANNEFILCYQPQIDLESERMVAAEVLIRWQHPQKGLLLPLDFIPLAEETGLIVPISEWVLRKACEQNKAWQNEGLPPIRISVNVTAQQFIHQNLVEVVSKILHDTQLNPEYLELELTENVIVSNIEVLNTIGELKKLGVTIAIDDFGTGYSSLSYLKKIPLDRLKIDSSFVQHIKSPSDDEVIIRAIIAMAKNLNLEVLAEGVETQDQLNFLKVHECGDVQGFYFSKPLTTKELEGYLKKSLKTSTVIMP